MRDEQAMSAMKPQTRPKGDAAGLDDETKVMLGAWLATEAITQG